jgi:WD repeat-containing protein 59
MDEDVDSTRPISAFESETFGQDTSFHLDQPVGSMSISPSGRDVVLASREGLHIIDLDSPYSPPRYLPHRTSWEVADVQWSPFAARDFWVVSTSNQKALVWNLGMSSWQGAIEFVLHGHSRAITDINFSAHDPDVLATCAVDSFVHCWDLRVPKTPVISFSDWFAGATQVKWNRQDSHVIASSHDKYLRIWDDRMGAYPVQSIEAHETKIYGIDWNRLHANKIITCSLDKTIKFWDCSNLEDEPERVIDTPFPVWRARHTPFGWGMLAMPQRGNSDLHLYDRRFAEHQVDHGTIRPVAEFPGHKGQVKEFLWRSRGSIIDGIDHRDFQLVSWGTDRELRLHRVEPDTFRAVGYEKGKSEISRLNFTRKGAQYTSFRNEPPRLKYGNVFDSRSDLSPALGQTFQLRPRGSTSVGMSKVPMSQSRGWFQGRALNLRIGMHGKIANRQDMNPIAWMQNVKITSWDQDSLAEEITQVGAKFTKVEFEAIDIPHRKATISLQAPSAAENSSIYIRAQMHFPKNYPREGSVDIKVQKTSSMTDELLAIISTELRTIAETYATKKRGCLEAVLRYLLHEQNMEQIVSWLLDEPLAQSGSLNDPGTPDDLSSDDDDDTVATFQGPSDLLHSSELFKTNVLVPVPKACGALWSDTGKLVCFFPPKAKQFSMVLDSLKKGDTNPTRTNKLLEGFGRLQTSSPGPKTTAGTVTTGDDAASETSDGSYLSSSSSSSSSDIIGSPPPSFLPPQAWRGGDLGLQRSRSTDRSNRSIAGLGTAKSTTTQPTNVVSIHSLETLLPFQLALAKEYRVFGSSSDVCDHNAEMARKHGSDNLAQVWGLVGLILRHEVPLDRTSGLLKGCDIITVARSAFSVLWHEDSGFDLSQDAAIESRRIAEHSMVRWGRSSFGSRYLIAAIFEHFEQLGDVQTLALLSCVLAEPKAIDSKIASLPQFSNDLPLQCPAFSVDYRPSIEVAQSLINGTPNTSFATADSKLLSTSAAMSDRSYPSNSTGVVGSSESPVANSTGTTPPTQNQTYVRRRSSRPSGLDPPGELNEESSSKSAAVSVSTSPEETRPSGRSTTAPTVSFTRGSLSTFTQSFSNSPPVHAIAKKPSPSGSLGTSGWSTPHGPGSSRGTRSDQSSSLPKVEEPLIPSHSRRNNTRSSLNTGNASKVGFDLKTNTGKRRFKIHSTLQNQNKFDLDGYASVPLLDPSLEWKFRSYRADYAHVLGAWELYGQMAEILKFNGLVSYVDPLKAASKVPTDRFASELDWSNIKGRETVTSISKAATAKRGLELRRRCRECGVTLQAIEKNGIPIGWHCTSPSCLASKTRTSSPCLCSICQKIATGLMIPCLQCGHVTCFACTEGWFGGASQGDTGPHPDSDSQDEGDLQDKRACPSGCGCDCLTHERISVPYPKGADSEPEEHNSDITSSKASAHSERLMSVHGPDSAIGAFLSLTRTRSISAAKESILGKRPTNESVAIEDGESTGSRPDQYNDPWGQYAGLGRGLGGGLSRGLKSQASDLTIKKNTP